MGAEAVTLIKHEGIKQKKKGGGGEMITIESGNKEKEESRYGGREGDKRRKGGGEGCFETSRRVTRPRPPPSVHRKLPQCSTKRALPYLLALAGTKHPDGASCDSVKAPSRQPRSRSLVVKQSGAGRPAAGNVRGRTGPLQQMQRALSCVAPG